MGKTLFDRYVEAVTFLSPVAEEMRVNRRVVQASWIRHQATPTTDGIAITLHDISTQKREEHRLRKASFTDDLTRLHNRRGFMALAEQQLRVARRQGKDAVVMYVDMNGFKELNDTFGHAIGDKALVEVARMLRNTVRDCDVVARLGGDEFTVLALDADGIGARVIQKRIEEQLSLLNASQVLPTTIGLTIGHTRVRPSDPAGICELLQRADQLLYARKRRRAITAAAAANKPARAPRRTPRPMPAVPIPAEVAAVAMAAARSLGTPATSGLINALTPAMPPAMPMERGVTSPA
jgi:diguanylate cyclase (GGDEF)-like protein